MTWGELAAAGAAGRAVSVCGAGLLCAGAAALAGGLEECDAACFCAAAGAGSKSSAATRVTSDTSNLLTIVNTFVGSLSHEYYH